MNTCVRRRRRHYLVTVGPRTASKYKRKRRRRPAVPVGNLVANGSFADWTNGIPDDWDTVQNVAREDPAFSNLIHTLPFAARLGAVPANAAVLEQVIDGAKPGFFYRFEFQLYTGIAQQAEVLFNGRSVVTINPNPIPGADGFSYYCAYTPCLPRKTEMRIRFTKTGPGLAIVDDVSVSAAGRC